MGLFTKTKLGFLGRSRQTLTELQELGDVATKAGLETLGRLTRTPVTTKTTRVSLVPRGAASAVLSAHQGAQIAARFPFRGAASGVVATFFAEDEARKLVELLLGREAGSVTKMGDLEESAVAEMTNIALNGAINGIAAHADARFDTGVPEVAYGVKDLDAFLSFEASGVVDHVVVVETPFVEPSRDVHGSMVLVFGLDAHRD